MASNFIRINGVEMPAPAPGYQIISSTVVDGGRNTEGAVVGQIIGRQLFKINNLLWRGLTAAEWKRIKDSLKPFYVNVDFIDDEGIPRSITMYPSDITAEPLEMERPSGSSCRKTKIFKSCSFNLIDCGW